MAKRTKTYNTRETTTEWPNNVKLNYYKLGMKIIDIKIINPDTKAPVSLEDWKKESDPTRAEWILIETDELKPFLLHKKLADGGRSFTFDEALKAGNTLTRAQGLALYNAKYNGLREALELIGGDPIRGWVWTCEADDPQCSAADAWYVGLNYGNVYYSTKTYGNQVRLVSAFNS